MRKRKKCILNRYTPKRLLKSPVRGQRLMAGLLLCTLLVTLLPTGLLNARAEESVPEIVVTATPGPEILGSQAPLPAVSQVLVGTMPEDPEQEIDPGMVITPEVEQAGLESAWDVLPPPALFAEPVTGKLEALAAGLTTVAQYKSTDGKTEPKDWKNIDGLKLTVDDLNSVIPYSFKMEYDFEIGKDKFEAISIRGSSYEITLPGGMTWSNKASVPFVVDIQGLGKVKMGTVAVSGSTATLTFDYPDFDDGKLKTFVETYLTGESVLEKIESCFISLDCALNLSALSGGENYENSINIAGTTITINIEKFNPEKNKPELTKRGAWDAASGTITWTTVITPKWYRNTENCAFVDPIAVDQTYVPGSFVVGGTSIPDSGSALRVVSAETGTQLIYAFPNTLGDQDITIQFKTKPTQAAFLNTGGTVKDKLTFKNQAALTSVEVPAAFGPIQSNEAKVDVTPGWLTKDGKHRAGSADWEWTLTINEGKLSLKDVVLTDIIPKGLKLMGEITVTGSTALYQTETTPNNNGTTTMEITWGELSDTVTIKYTTTIDPNSYFEGVPAKNIAKLEFSYEGSGGGAWTGHTAEVGVDVGTLSAIAKDGKYDPQSHRIHWTITVNADKLPLWGAKVTDTLKEPRRNKYIPSTFECKIDGTTDTTIVTPMNETGTSFTLDLGDKISGKTAVITFQTELTIPTEYAYNNDPAGISNKAQLSAKVSENGPVLSGNEVTKWVSIVNDVLQKKVLKSYNYSNQEIVWQLTVNSDKKPMKNAVVTDLLPANLTYVKDSLTATPGGEIGHPTIASERLENGQEKLTISLGDLADEKTVTLNLRTKLNIEAVAWESDGIPRKEIATLANTAWLNYEGYQDGETYAKVTVESGKINCEVIGKNGQADTTDSTGYRVTYNILVNKLMLDLVKTQGEDKQNFITDTLGAGLQVDLSTLKLWHGTVNSAGNGLDTLDKTEVPLYIGGAPLYTYEGGIDQSVLMVPLPKAGESDTSAYLLTYSVDIVKDLSNGDQKITNAAKLNEISTANIKTETKVTIKNIAAGGSADRMALLKLIKVGDNGKPLAGATFTLYDQNGIRLNEATTEADGKISFKVNYFKGEVDSATQFYRIVETAAPIGHDMVELWKMGVSITPKTGGVYVWDSVLGTVQDGYLKVTNNIRRNTIVFTKQNDLGYPLAGAEFGLFVGDEKSPRYTATSTNDGEVRFGGSSVSDKIPYGAYKLKELKAPANHALNETVYTVSVDGDGKVTKIKDGDGNEITQEGREVIVNIALKGSITVIKVAEADTKKTLAGAAFTLYDSAGEQVAVSKATGEDGKVLFENLMLGMEYTIKESIAPSGYQLGGEQKVTLALDPVPADLEGATETASVQNVTLTFQNKLIPPPTPSPTATPGGSGGGGGGGSYPTTSPRPTVSPSGSPSPSPSGSPSPSPSGSPSPSPSGSPSPSPSVAPSPSPSASPTPTPSPTPGGVVNPDNPPVNPVNPVNPPAPVQPIPAQPVPGGGVQGTITADDPDYYIDDNGVPRGRGDMPDPVFWIDDDGVPLGYMDEEGEWVEIGPDDIPLGFMGPDGWVEFPPQTGDEADGWGAAFLLLGTVFVGMTGVLVWQAVGSRKRRNGHGDPS